jgi:hypothetical protein
VERGERTHVDARNFRTSGGQENYGAYCIFGLFLDVTGSNRVGADKLIAFVTYR